MVMLVMGTTNIYRPYIYQVIKLNEFKTSKNCNKLLFCNRNGEVEDSTEHPGQGIGLTEKCRPVRAKYEPLTFTKECFKELFTFLSFRLQ